MSAARRSEAGMRATRLLSTPSTTEVGRSSQSHQYARNTSRRLRSQHAPRSPRRRFQHRAPAGRRSPPGARPIPDGLAQVGAAAHALPRARRRDQRRGRRGHPRRGRRGGRSAREAGIDELLAFATSAIREAANGEEVLELVERETGVACRCSRATTSRGSPTSPSAAGTAGRPGGCCSSTSAAARSRSRRASTRFPMSRGRSRSAPAARRSRSCPTTRPRPNRSHDSAPTRARCSPERGRRVRRAAAPDHVVGSSKTIRSLARLAGRRRRGLRPTSAASSPARARRLDAAARAIPADARPALPGITADRTFQIVAGAVVLSEAMRAFGVDELEVSPWALREGLILRRLDRLT